jgi:putative flavoprotein involved in K+ transport
MERVPVVVIGAGQAGLAASSCLDRNSVPHVVLEAGRIGETWATRRWRSFRLVSPNWLNQLPGFSYDGPDPDGFFDAAEMIGFLDAYARSFSAPVRESSRVRAVRPSRGGGFVLETDDGSIACRAVVVATGAFGRPRIPGLAARLPAEIVSIHTDGYWAPEDLPPGAVLVVGAGQSGLQIADELVKTGRTVWVAVGRHGWVPRRVYGRDQMYWRLENGDFQTIVGDPDAPAADYPFTALSRWGDADFNVRTVFLDGCRLLGHVTAIDGPIVQLSDDLHVLLRAGDDYASTFVGRVRDFARSRGEEVDEPVLESRWRDGEMPQAPSTLDLVREGISTVIWTTGYEQDFGWIDVPGALASNGAPYQRRGVSPVEGLYYVGLHRMWEAASGTVLGAGWVAKHLATVIAETVDRS